MYRMTDVPVTIVDGFYDRPAELLDLAKEVKYYKDPENRWPGERSPCLSTVDYYTFNMLALGVLKLFSSDEVEAYRMSAFFQKVPKEFGGGWVHSDTNLFSSVLYLNPQSSQKGGTSTYNLKRGLNRYDDLSNFNLIKRKALLEWDAATYSEQGKLNNDMFTIDIQVPSKFNRLVCFDGQVPHAAGSFSEYGEEDRLTLVMFFHSVEFKNREGLPLPRTKKVYTNEQ